MRLTISSLRRADWHLRRKRYDALVSIGYKGVEHCTERAKRNLLLDFYDVTPVSHRHRDELPTVENVVELIRFSQSLECKSSVLFHCKQGRSRSTASAIIALLAREAPEEKACNMVYEAAPRATPNWFLLSIADQLLGTNVLGYCRSTGRKLKAARRDITL